MDLLKAHIGIVPNSQSRLGQFQFLLSLTSWSGVICSLGVYYSKDKATFKCNTNESLSLVNQFCYEHYDEDYNSPLPQITFALINGCVLIGIWLAFALYLGPKLVLFKRRTNADHVLEGLRQLHMGVPRDQENKFISVYGSYLLQILIRVVFVVAMVALLLSYQTFKQRKSFTCILEEEHIDTICSDPYSADKQRTNIAMLILDIILIFLALVEAILMLVKANRCGRQAIGTDSESVNLLESGVFPNQYVCCWCPLLGLSDVDFVGYLLRENLQEGPNATTLNIRQLSDDFKEMIIDKTMNLALVLPLPLPFNPLPTDSLYTTVVLRTEFEVANRASNANTEQLTLGDIFKQGDGNTTTGKANTIMVYGCAGIGKTMFCHKLARDWATGVLSVTNGECKRFQFVFLLKFKELNFITRNVSLTQLLNCSTFSRIDDESFRWIARCIPFSILIIFDGLDAFKSLSSCAGDLFSYADDEAEMPVSAWYAKLVSGRILRGCTVITTSRADSLHALPASVQHDKVVKICGFTLEKAKEFIGKLLVGESEARDSVFELISSNRGIESLVCSPENCIIISCSFLYKAREAKENNDQASTLTEIYTNLLHLYTILHNPNCRGTIPAPEFPQAVLTSLFALAYKGIESATTLFTRRDIEEFALQEEGIEPLIKSGLLNCAPLTQTGPAHFDMQYCFNFIMQDFLAAKHIVTTLSETEFVSFVSSFGMSKKWDMVLQFVAGLLKPCGEARMRKLLHGLQASFAQSKVRSKSEQLLLAARCCIEYNDDSITRSELAAGLQGCIDLGDCQISVADNRVVIYLLSRCEPGVITSLRMLNSFLGSKECEELGKSIASHHGPTDELDISKNSIGDDGVESFCRALRASHCTLQHLNLSANGISSYGIQCLLDALTESQCQLQMLNLAYNDFDNDNARQLSDMLLNQNFPLKNLSVAGCGMQDPVIKCLITPSKFHIQHLDLSDNNFAKHGILHLADALAERECYLHSLKLRGNCLSDDSLYTLACSLTHRHCKLQRLDLASTGITDTGARYIAKRLKNGDCKLKFLDISENNFGNAGCSHIAKAVAAPSSVLQELNMQRNKISDREALLFLKCFKNPKVNKLCSLYLGENNISSQVKSQLVCSFLEEAFYWEQSHGKLCL